METQKNSENNIVLEMRRLLGRMMVQVDYMYRNDREMSRLDLDIMMERTRDFYDLLCDYQADKLNDEMADEDVADTGIEGGGQVVNKDVELEIDVPTNVSAEKNPADEESFVEEKKEEDIIEEEKIIDEKEEDEDDWEDDEDVAFHVEPVEDNSLAARLHHTPVADIRTALGINDKMMIINDLFKGSLERYSKSINALNEFPTLSGAKVYMSELQIELQWDVESQAYAILNDLVERRFL